MTRSIRFIVIFAISAAALMISGCPSPFNTVSEEPVLDQPESYQTSAEVSFDSSRGVVVFTEEDGTETPVVVIKDGIEDGPVEIIDYKVLDDGGSSTGRFSSSNNRARCIVVGRRRDGRSGVWVIYRHGGVQLLLNENGDPVLEIMVEVEGSPFLGDGWSYVAKKLEVDPDTKDGIIIGTLSRPNGWEYPELHSVDDPASIGIFWSIHEVNGIPMVSRARPILLMNEPESKDFLSLHSGRRRRSEWRDMLREWLQTMFLNKAWNYLVDAERFVSDAEYEKEGYGDVIPVGTFIVAGPGKGKYGTKAKAWAWLTYKSVENIVDVPEDNGGGNQPPYAVSGPIGLINYSQNDKITLKFKDTNGDPVPLDGGFDQEDDYVTFTVLTTDWSYGAKVPTGTVESLVIKDFQNPDIEIRVLVIKNYTIGTTASFKITTHDDLHVNEPVQPLNEILVLFVS